MTTRGITHYNCSNIYIHILVKLLDITLLVSLPKGSSLCCYLSHVFIIIHVITRDCLNNNSYFIVFKSKMIRKRLSQDWTPKMEIEHYFGCCDVTSKLIPSSADGCLLIKFSNIKFVDWFFVTSSTVAAEMIAYAP